ncbi:L-threonine synthase [Thermosporothrix hazakensis]|jgi:threonine synthase|uniref:L-threonine synthase n=1 Tax=Thermosporothrix hazakensis TaxID=644383 RepID=A0A326U1V1_THEHA|nr:pyridoxal-phosphate dependent enzyme [Thermosporothrix hazakensis]PZW24076.1 L-threonine synthase [Thermosporothrix hazakensis]GCE50289.1 threonine synthase [Thermosporothrix hazakensis]
MFATGLRCFRCGRVQPFTPSAYLCPHCGAADDDPGILDVLYDYDAIAPAFEQGREKQRPDLFRFLPLLPVNAVGPVLPAGGTPLVAAPRLAQRLGLAQLYLKDETRNPTRCLKDRATAVGVTMALEQGYRTLYCASAGNAAISLAGFCAHLGLACQVFVPHAVSTTRLRWLQRYRAIIHISDGDYDQAYAEAEAAGQEQGWYSRNCACNPFLVEGKKTVALEIGEQLHWQVPDMVVAPVGDGCTLGAIGKGFRELRRLGLADRLPRLLGVQAETVQPVVSRYHGVKVGADRGPTAAASIDVKKPRNYLRLRAELDASSGSMLAVSDAEMEEARCLLACEAGLVAELTSAASLAALFQLARQESLQGKTAVLVITGGRNDGDS